MNNICEMVEKELCLGCVGLVERDWRGKYYCKEYKRLRGIYNGNKNPAIMQVKKEQPADNKKSTDREIDGNSEQIVFTI